MQQVILSIFPSIDLLGRAFEEEMLEVCIVRGPDLLWGGDIRRFHVPAGVFWGVIGGPPCQAFSNLVHVVRANGHEPRHGNLIPEFERIVLEACPAWFVMEEVPRAPSPKVQGYTVNNYLLNNRWVGGIQNRERRFSFGTLDGRQLQLDVDPMEPSEWSPTVTCDMRKGGTRVKAGGGVMPHVGPKVPLAEMCRLQGLPESFLADAPFTDKGKREAVGNGVPLPMGRAIARAVKRAIS